MNNNAFGTIAGLEKAHFDTTYGTTFPGKVGESLPDYAAVARAYGAEGFQVESADQFLPILQKALSVGGPVVVDVPMKNNPTPTTGHWNILDIYSPGRDISHSATE
jgi:acetolactate synthase-1/2/3 large subunit